MREIIVQICRSISGRQNHAAQVKALAVNMLGRRIDDHMRAPSSSGFCCKGVANTLLENHCFGADRIGEIGDGEFDPPSVGLVGVFEEK